MSRVLYRIGHSAARHPWRVLATWALLAVVAVFLNGAVGGTPDETFRLPGAESQTAADAIQDRFPQQTLYTSNVIFHSDEGVTEPEQKRAIEQAVADLADGPHVVDVHSPYDPRGPTVSEDGTTAFATVAFSVEKAEPSDLDAAEKAVQPARDAGVQVEYDGQLGYANVDDGGSNSELIGIIVAVVVLAIAFGSLVAMSLPIVVALLGILIGSSTIGILSGFAPVPEIATIVGMMMGLGVGIDYALFILARHRQNLESGTPVPDAVGRANATAGLSVLFAGFTVMVAIAGLQVSNIPMMTMMGWSAAIMVAVSMLAAITLLPALLGLVGRKVNRARIPFIKPRSSYDPSSLSGRWTARVVAKPVRYGLVATIVLGVLALPVLGMRLGFADAGNDAPDSTTHQAYDLIADGYGAGANGPFSVVLEADSDATVSSSVPEVTHALENTPGVASVGDATVNDAKDLAVIEVVPTTAPQDAKTSQLLSTIREDTLPGALDSADVTASVTGQTALTDDVSSRLQERMPWFLAAVIGLSFVILTIVFRSVLVPLKAAALNVLGVGAAYGVVVAIFQWGWGASLIGVHETTPIMPLAPMLMFAILFGLSMDYEVFLISRIRELYLKYRDPKRATVEGVGSTARVITSAGLIMISVFAAFILMPDPVAKLFGVGLAVAVFLDVTLIRMVLVPAAMSLLGHRAWWLPRWLDRRLPAIHLEGDETESDQTAPAAEEKELVPA